MDYKEEFQFLPRPIKLENEKKLKEELSLDREPEMEEFNEDIMIRNLLKELNVEEFISENVDPLVHDPNKLDNCIHCMLFKKIATLQTEITKMNTEISCTHEILNLKKSQNAELKSTIKRLESTIGNSVSEMMIEQKEPTCTCGAKCMIF